MALHVRFILKEMIRRGWKVHLVTTERATKHPAYKMVEDEFGGQYTLHLMPDAGTETGASDLQRFKDQFRRLEAYRTAHQQLMTKHAIDAVYMVNLDQADLPMALKGSPFGKTPFCGMLIGRHFHAAKMGVKMEAEKLRDKIFGPVFSKMIRIPSLKRALILDPTLVNFAHQSKLRGHEKVQYVPDVSSLAVRPHAKPPRELLGLPSDAFVVLAYGALSLRKGVTELVAALAHPDCPPNAVVLFAGRQDTEAKAVLAGPEATQLREDGRLFELVKFLDDEDESMVFQACDAVWLGYRHWLGMSGVLVQAATAGKPVLAMEQGLVGYLTDHHKIGLTAKFDDPALVAANINKLMTHPELTQELSANGKKMAQDHTPELFGQRICDHILGTAARS